MEQRGIVTEFVSDNFFDRSSRLFRFLSVVISHYNEMVKKFREERNLGERDVFFIFKGGNVLRVIAKDFFLELPENTNRIIVNYYSSFFKRSDADFSIYLNPDLENYDKYFQELVILTYYEQVKIKKIFLNNETRYFDFFCYNEPHKKKLLSSLLKKLNYDDVAVGEINYQQSIDYTSIDDFEYLVKEGSPTKKVIAENESYLYTSINQSFDDTLENGWRTKFSLIRTKVHFVFQKDGKTKNIDGELIDVSMPHRNSSELKIFYQQVDQNIVAYTLRRKSEKIIFYSYTVEYLIKDLERILFLQSIYPWNDDKYVKRLNRLIFMYFIEIFVKVDNSDNRIAILNDTYSYFDTGNMKKVYLNYDLSIGRFFDYIKKLDRNNFTKKDVAEMENMYSIIKQNLLFLSESLENIKFYCKTDGNVTEQDISSIKMNQYI